MNRYPGPAAMDWLTKVPVPLVNACISMLPVLEAEANLALVKAIQIGTGSMPADRATGILSGWDNSAYPKTPEDTRKPDPTVLTHFGIPVRRLRKKRPA